MVSKDFIIAKCLPENTMIEISRELEKQLLSMRTNEHEPLTDVIESLIYDVKDTKKVNQLKNYKIKGLRKRR